MRLCQLIILNAEIVGFINGTCTIHKEIHHDTMSFHDPSGSYLVVHSVTVARSHRRCGLGLAMLQDYIQYLVWFRPEIRGVRNMCLYFYFTYLSVNHGWLAAIAGDAAEQGVLGAILHACWILSTMP